MHVVILSLGEPRQLPTKRNYSSFSRSSSQLLSPSLSDALSLSSIFRRTRRRRPPAPPNRSSSLMHRQQPRHKNKTGRYCSDNTYSECYNFTIPRVAPQQQALRAAPRGAPRRPGGPHTVADFLPQFPGQKTANPRAPNTPLWIELVSSMGRRSHHCSCSQRRQSGFYKIPQKAGVAD